MVPESVNLSDLSEQLLVDGVALERDNDALHQDLMAAKDYAASRGVGELGIAVLEAPPARLADISTRLHISPPASRGGGRSP